MTAAGPTADVLDRWLTAAVADLARNRAALDRLNVFPVPDADTGSNLHLTLRDAAAALRAVEAQGAPSGADGLRLRVDALLRGALLGARGSSGVIVSQYLAGLVPALVLAGRVEPRDGADDAAALRAGADAARSAVAVPVEGTVLTVADALAEGAQRAVHEGAQRAVHEGGADRTARRAVWTGALEAGVEALRRTQEVHPVLRAAGVPDAGGWGLLLVVAALARTWAPPGEQVGGRDGGRVGERDEGRVGGPEEDLVRLPSPEEASAPAGHGRSFEGGRLAETVHVTPTSAGGEHGEGNDGDHDHDHDHDGDGDGGEFEVMFVEEVLAGSAVADPDPDPDPDPPSGPDPGAAGSTRARADAAEDQRVALSVLGDSVAVVAASGTWQAHVHTDRPVDVLRLPVPAGRVRHQVSIRHLLRQSGVHGEHEPVLGLVAVTRAPGLVADLARAGAVVLLDSAECPVDPAEVARAVADTGAREVLVLAPRALQVTDRPEPGVVVHLRDVGSEGGVVAAVAALLESDGPVPARLTLVDAAVAHLARTALGRGPLDPSTVASALTDVVGDALRAATADPAMSPAASPTASPAASQAASPGAGAPRPAVLVRLLLGGTASDPANGSYQPELAVHEALAARLATAVSAQGCEGDVVVLDLAGDLGSELTVELDGAVGAAR